MKKKLKVVDMAEKDASIKINSWGKNIQIYLNCLTTLKE